MALLLALLFSYLSGAFIMEGISDSPASGLFISLAVTLSLYF
jgi:hypothetical protein